MTRAWLMAAALAAGGAAMDTENHYASPIDGEGRVEFDPVAGGKMFQGTWLVTRGSRYLLSYRPDKALLKFANKRVVFKGRPYRPGRDVQHILAEHLHLDQIALAPGEAPWPVEPTEVPPPKTARSKKEVEALSPGWARVVGTIAKIAASEQMWTKATLRFDDGSTIDAPSVRREDWSKLAGKRVTVIASVGPERAPAPIVSLDAPRDTTPSPIVLFPAPDALCEGDVADCGARR